MGALLGVLIIVMVCVGLFRLRQGAPLGAVIVMIAMAVAVTAPPWTQALAKDAKAVAAGIGLSRAKVVALFKAHGCRMEKTDVVNGLERWTGRQGVILCEALGPAAETKKVFLLHGVPSGDPKTAMNAMVVATEIVKAVAPQWTDSGKWIMQAVGARGSSTVRDGLRFELMLTGLGIGISVEPATPEAAKTVVGQAKGIGISRTELEALYARTGFAQKTETPVDGSDNIVGRAPGGVSQIVARNDTVVQTSITTFITEDDDKNMANTLRMGAMVWAVFPGWDGGMNWILAAISRRGDHMTRDGKVLTVTVKTEIGAILVSIAPVD